jgi:hypothetical protein
MTFVSLALLGSMRGWRKPEIANIKSTSTGPNNGERLPPTTAKHRVIVRQNVSRRLLSSMVFMVWL